MFKDNWFQPQKARGVDEALSQVAAEGCVMEVGCWEGKSTSHLANAVRPTVVYCFDHWQGDPADSTYAKARERDVFSEFVANMDQLTDRNYLVFKGDWRDTLPAFLAHNPVRFLYLDAGHTYHEVREQLALIVPVLASGAVLAGDDYRARPGVGMAVRERLGDAPVTSGKWNGVWYWRSP